VDQLPVHVHPPHPRLDAERRPVEHDDVGVLATPDGNYIIARLGGDSNNDGRGELWMWHIDGGAGVRVTARQVAAVSGMSPSRGRHLVRVLE
jgi:hypothetical protein